MASEDVADNVVRHIPRLSDSDFETRADYNGLPSTPISVYHTGARWKRPRSWGVPKEARPICKHPIADVWDELGPQVLEYLDSVNLKWTSIDVTRFAEVGEIPGPVFLWVGVKPGSLSRGDAEVTAVGCKKLLEGFELNDVEVAFRESLFTRSAGPQLLDYYVRRIASFDPSPYVKSSAEMRTPLTPTLGLHIAARATPHCEGTGGIYICEGGESKSVFVLTARHVVIPPHTGDNELYPHKKARLTARHVLLLGSKAFQEVLESIMDGIWSNNFDVDDYKDQLESLEVEAGEAHDDDDERKRIILKGLLKEAEEGINTLDEFHSEFTKHWSAESRRVLGHIALSPPISVGTGPKRFTEDWALIELHDERIDWEGFKGNVIDLGTKISAFDFMRKMFPNPKDHTLSNCPRGRILQLRDVIKDNELRNPTMVDANGEECLIVFKNGNRTGMTIGRATGIMSFVREYFEDGTHRTSMELPIYPYSIKHGPTFGPCSAFSAPGDSGSIIADGEGRIIGLLTGGAGKGDSTDVSYATPFYWLFDECIKAHFPNAYLYPVKASD